MKAWVISKFSWRGKKYEIGDVVDVEEALVPRMINEGHISVNAPVEPAAPEQSESVPAAPVAPGDATPAPAAPTEAPKPQASKPAVTAKKSKKKPGGKV